tara:strand:- start:527 stop:628 length:102 start_codon:yes stop_codon:yes gene_type:complete
MPLGLGLGIFDAIDMVMTLGKLLKMVDAELVKI